MLAYAGSVSCLRDERQLRNAIIMGFPTSIEQSISEFSRFYHIHRLWYLCDTYSNVFSHQFGAFGGCPTSEHQSQVHSDTLPAVSFAVNESIQAEKVST